MPTRPPDPPRAATPPSPARRLRTLVVGARRARQGIGEFVARFLLEAGAEVCAVVGTTPETAAAALAKLRQAGLAGGLAYSDLEVALERERPEVVAICTPYLRHRAALELAARFGAHCLCEKPLWWEPDWPADGSRERETRRLVGLFRAKGLRLDLVTQWPCTLEGFYRLYPQERGRPIRSFHMELAPVSSGRDMIPDAAPHLLSMLRSLLGSGVIAEVRAHFPDADERRLRLEFACFSAGGATAVTFQCATCERPPRPAAYGINDKLVRRQIELPDYRMYLEAADQRRQEIVDPLRTLVEGFLRKVERGEALDPAPLIEGVVGLERLSLALRPGTSTAPPPSKRS